MVQLMFIIRDGLLTEDNESRRLLQNKQSEVTLSLLPLNFGQNSQQEAGVEGEAAWSSGQGQAPPTAGWKAQEPSVCHQHLSISPVGLQGVVVAGECSRGRPLLKVLREDSRRDTETVNHQPSRGCRWERLVQVHALPSR